jgi:predicted HAD superfamily phosphohydrolase YqeG
VSGRLRQALDSRRVAHLRINEIADLWARPLAYSEFIIDLENTVLSYGATAAFDRSVVALRDLHLELLPGRVVLVTNSRDGGLGLLARQATGFDVVERAHKPFTSRAVLARYVGRDPIVVGDQPLTDGLLAWRLRCPFVELRLHDQVEPLWPRLLRLGGAVVGRLIFTDDSQTVPKWGT